MFKVLVLICLGIFSYANSLNVVNGEVKAHTEVFGDSKINPSTKDVKGELTMNDSIESLKGKIYFKTLSLISDTKDRDAHMYELLNSTKYDQISFNLLNVIKSDSGYEISGVLTLNGVSKSISSKSTIINENALINLKGDFAIKLTDFGMKPPKLLFLTVRDQIDINYDINIK